MGTSADIHRIRRRRRFRLAAILFGSIAGLILVEIGARLAGFRPFAPATPVLQITPGGHLFQALAEGGYRHLPGEFKIDLSPEFNFHLRHEGFGLRATSEPVDYSSGGDTRPALWFMGCSLTHGWGVNDEETYAWKVQSALPSHKVVNAGVSGYGTLQSRLLFQDLVTNGRRPALVVYAYGLFHDFRNTFVRTWQKGFIPPNRLPDLNLPSAHINGTELDYQLEPAVYREFPFQRSLAFSHLLEQQYNLWEANRSHSHEVSRQLIASWAANCLKEKIPFVLAGISSDSRDMLEWCATVGIPAVDISVPLSNPENTNHPYDNHPNAATHSIYAERLVEYLQEKRFFTPE
jgi:hypothetical protein